MTFTAEPNIGSHLVEATPPNLLEHIDEHIKFLRNAKSPSQEASEEGTSRTRKAR